MQCPENTTEWCRKDNRLLWMRRAIQNSSVCILDGILYLSILCDDNELMAPGNGITVPLHLFIAKVISLNMRHTKSILIPKTRQRA